MQLSPRVFLSCCGCRVRCWGVAAVLVLGHRINQNLFDPPQTSQIRCNDCCLFRGDWFFACKGKCNVLCKTIVIGYLLYQFPSEQAGYAQELQCAMMYEDIMGKDVPPTLMMQGCCLAQTTVVPLNPVFIISALLVYPITIIYMPSCLLETCVMLQGFRLGTLRCCSLLQSPRW